MENNKNVIKEEDLEKVTGGALAGLSVPSLDTQIKYTEPVSPYANTTPETLATPITVKNPDVIAPPVYNGSPIKTK